MKRKGRTTQNLESVQKTKPKPASVVRKSKHCTARAGEKVEEIYGGGWWREARRGSSNVRGPGVRRERIVWAAQREAEPARAVPARWQPPPTRMVLWHLLFKGARMEGGRLLVNRVLTREAAGPLGCLVISLPRNIP